VHHNVHSNLIFHFFVVHLTAIISRHNRKAHQNCSAFLIGRALAVLTQCIFAKFAKHNVDNRIVVYTVIKVPSPLSDFSQYSKDEQVIVTRFVSENSNVLELSLNGNALHGPLCVKLRQPSEPELQMDH
jgi:hypothetical protein